MTKVRIDVTKDVTGRLNIKPIKVKEGYKYGGLVPVTIVSVMVEHQPYTKGEFEGLDVPVLRFDFKQIDDEIDRYQTLSIKPIGTKIYEGDELVQNSEDKIREFIFREWGKIKHVIDCMSNSSNYKPIESLPKAQLSKHFDEFPIDGEPKEILAKYESFFTFIANFIDNDGKPMYKTKGKGAEQIPLEFWLKLLPNYPEKRYYTIPGYVGKGFLEPIKRNEKGMLLPAKILEVDEMALRLANITVSTSDASSPDSAPGDLDPELAKFLV